MSASSSSRVCRKLTKAHIGIDGESGLVHHVECTAVNVNDVTQVHKLLHGKEDRVRGDSGYGGADKRGELQGVEAVHWIVEKPSKLRAMKNKHKRRYAERWEHFMASVRAKVEHPFRVVKRQFGYTKKRYRGLMKNTMQNADTVRAVEPMDGAATFAASAREIPSGRRGNPSKIA